MEKRYIRFDWAMKRLLRDKTNFVVLEGFLTTLLGRKVAIKSLLESESNRTDEADKQNRVDILAEDADGSLMLIEVQTTTMSNYLHRMLYGASKLITDYMHIGMDYSEVRKVYSINIVYFPLGVGTDCVYRGSTIFRGIHDGDILGLSPKQKKAFGVGEVEDLYPEYYLLKVNDFDRVARTPLDEWLAYLKSGEIADSSVAPGLPEVRRQLQIDQMSPAERNDYYRHLDDDACTRNCLRDNYEEGYYNGEEQGWEKCSQYMRNQMRDVMLAQGYTGEQVDDILAKMSKQQ